VTVVSVYAIFANAKEAERIGRQVIEERLAACINILGGCRSIYRWQGAIETAGEVPAIFKTTAEGSEALIARIIELHSYEVPAVTVWPILRLPSAYGDWVEASVGRG
jgi:periplasmic divalent cation tolerance protein